MLDIGNVLPDGTDDIITSDIGSGDDGKGGFQFFLGFLFKGRNGVGGRRFLMNISKYNANNEYGVNSVDTSANLADGQIKF